MKFEFMPRYTKYLCWYNTELPKTKNCYFMLVLPLLVLLVCLFFLRSCPKESVPTYKAHYRPEELNMIKVFKKHGSDQPEAMAIAVCKTKKPFLMAAIAIKESNGKPKAVGDSGDSKGAWQVQEKHWSKVPTSATEQALQAEKILEELVQSSRGKLRSGLAKYNGGIKPPKSSHRYANDVLKLMRRIKT